MPPQPSRYETITINGRQYVVAHWPTGDKSVGISHTSARAAAKQGHFEYASWLAQQRKSGVVQPDAHGDDTQPDQGQGGDDAQPVTPTVTNPPVSPQQQSDVQDQQIGLLQTQVADLKNQIAEKDAQIAELTAQLATQTGQAQQTAITLDEQLQASKARINQLLRQVASLKQQDVISTGRIQTFTSSLGDALEKIKTLEHDKVISTGRIQTLTSSLGNALKEISKLKADLIDQGPLTEEIAAKVKQIEELESLLDRYRSDAALAAAAPNLSPAEVQPAGKVAQDTINARQRQRGITEDDLDPMNDFWGDYSWSESQQEAVLDSLLMLGHYGLDYDGVSADVKRFFQYLRDSPDKIATERTMRDLLNRFEASVSSWESDRQQATAMLQQEDPESAGKLAAEPVSTFSLLKFIGSGLQAAGHAGLVYVGTRFIIRMAERLGIIESEGERQRRILEETYPGTTPWEQLGTSVPQQQGLPATDAPSPQTMSIQRDQQDLEKYLTDRNNLASIINATAGQGSNVMQRAIDAYNGLDTPLATPGKLDLANAEFELRLQKWNEGEKQVLSAQERNYLQQVNLSVQQERLKQIEADTAHVTQPLTILQAKRQSDILTERYLQALEETKHLVNQTEMMDDQRALLTAHLDNARKEYDLLIEQIRSHQGKQDLVDVQQLIADQHLLTATAEANMSATQKFLQAYAPALHSLGIFLGLLVGRGMVSRAAKAPKPTPRYDQQTWTKNKGHK